MSNKDLANINIILATDCGSTTTKAILIQKIDGKFRQTHRGEAPTSVEEPFADVTVGVINAVTEVSELADRKLVDDDGKIIQPADKESGCDLYISTSSAGGGLQMMVAGVIAEMTAASAKRAALGAGAIVMDVIASNDKRKPHDRIQRIRDLRPDMMLLSGGTDGGTLTHIMEIAELIAPAKPQPRFGSQYSLPIIYAGNKNARDNITELFKDEYELTIVQNLRPILERENLGPARDAIHDLFLEHVMAHAPGYNKLMKWTDAPIMPTPGAVGNILQTIADKQNINVVGVDIGGATTDVFSVFDGKFNRTVSANLGMSYSISNVCAEATMENILRWVHLDMDERELRNRVKNKMIRPTTIPQTKDALIFEQAVAREALRLAYKQHKEFATTLKGVQQQRTVGDTFSQETSGQSIVNNMKLDLLVASGGVLSHAPEMQQTAMMLIDAFQPEGITRLSKDSIFMMPHLGVLAQVHPDAAMEVFERDCLINLGTVVSPKGNSKLGKSCFSYTISGNQLNESGDIKVGEIKLFSLNENETAKIIVEPDKIFDFGNGPGKILEAHVKGGAVGLILDARGRPTVFSEDRSKCAKQMNQWVSDLNLYPELVIEPNLEETNIIKDNKSSKKAHAYTPGLKVSQFTNIQKNRTLPIKGKVLVKKGEFVNADQVVAETYMPGNVIPVNISNLLSLPPRDIPDCMMVKLGDKVNAGDILAETKGIFGYLKNACESKYSGTVETISEITGQVILRGEPHPVQVLGFLPGKIIEVIDKQGVIISEDVSYIQGIFGIGGEAFGELKSVCEDNEEILSEKLITDKLKGKIIIGGGRMTSDAVRKAISVGVSGIISGGIDDQDLKTILGYDLGVAITGTEKLGITLIITEGFGDIAMAKRTFQILKSCEDNFASINGATQIRAGVIRPEIIIKKAADLKKEQPIEKGLTGALDLNCSVRIIRDPYFGKIGKVSKLPSSPQVLESGTKTRVLRVIIDNETEVTIPRANIELIES